VNTAATQQLLSTLQTQLGSAFQQSTVTNDLQTSFVKEGGDFSAQDLMGIVVAVAASIATAGAAAAAMGTTLTAMTVPQAMIAAAASGMVSSALSQTVTGEGFSLDRVFEAGAVGALTAGITDGITYNSTTGSLGLTPLDQGLNSLPQNVSTLGQLAGITSVGNALSGTVPQAGAVAAENLPTELAALGANAVISSGVQTAIEGGSFLDNLKTAGVQEVAADVANAIGQAAVYANQNPNSSQLLALNSPGHILAHAALGCAASAALGTDCEGGAIGGATSALLSPQFLGALDPNHDPVTSGQTAMTAGLATLAGAIAAGLAGAKPQGGASSAENEAVNNAVPDFTGFGVTPSTAKGLGIQATVNGYDEQLTDSSLKMAAPFIGAPVVVYFGGAAITGAALAGLYDYGGDYFSYKTGLSVDPPNFNKSFTVGVFAGLAAPLAITDKAVSGASTAEKILAATYNSTVNSGAAYTSAVLTNQNAGLTATVAGGGSFLGGIAKIFNPGVWGNIMNQIIQGGSGPFQSAIQNSTNGK